MYKFLTHLFNDIGKIINNIFCLHPQSHSNLFQAYNHIPIAMLFLIQLAKVCPEEHFESPDNLVFIEFLWPFSLGAIHTLSGFFLGASTLILWSF